MSGHYVTAWVQDKQGRMYVLSQTTRGDLVWASASNNAVKFANVNDMLHYFTSYTVGARVPRGATLLYRKSRGKGYYHWPSLSTHYRQIKANPDDDGDDQEAYNEMKVEIESGEAYVIGDVRGGYYVNLLGETYQEFDRAVRAIATDMRKSNYYPNVYYVNDHGNVDLLSLKIGKALKGGFVPVSYKTVASWV